MALRSNDGPKREADAPPEQAGSRKRSFGAQHHRSAFEYTTPGNVTLSTAGSSSDLSLANPTSLSHDTGWAKYADMRSSWTARPAVAAEPVLESALLAEPMTASLDAVWRHRPFGQPLSPACSGKLPFEPSQHLPSREDGLDMESDQDEP